MPDARVPANAAIHLVERHRARWGDAVAVVDDHGSRTFDELSGACGRAGAGLHGLGVRPGTGSSWRSRTGGRPRRR